MTDNIVIPGGSGFAFAADNISSVLYPRVKIAVGADGANDGDVSLANGLPVTVTGPLTAFGEIQAEMKTPQVQMRFPYNVVHPDIGQSLTNKSGSTVTVADAQASVTCSATAESFSQIRTMDTVRYGSGQGALFMGTCCYTTGVALSTQEFGIGDDDEGLFIGYNGADFGVVRKTHGSLEIKSLTITAGADGSGGTFTLTIDSTAVVVTVAASDTIAEVCAAIVAEASAIGDAGRGWEVHTDDNVSVEFISLVAEVAGGTFSFSDTGTSGVTATGGFTQEVTGVAPTEVWVLQAAWNGDVMDGTGPSGMTLDPTKGNVFKIQFQYLGYGAQEFSIEDQATGRFVVVHTMHYTNQNVIPWCVDPTFHLTLIAKTATGYGGGALTMKTASMAGFIQGVENPDGIRRSAGVTKTSTTAETVLLIIHSELDFNSLRNKVTVYPDFVNFSHDGSKPITINLYKNPTSIVGGTALTDVQAGVSTMQYSSAGTTVTGGAKLLTFTLEGVGKEQADLAKLRAKIRPGERYVFTHDAVSGGTGETTIGVSWVERV